MTDRSPWLIALATANFVVLVALAALAKSRFESIESRLADKDAPRRARPGADTTADGAGDVKPARRPGSGRDADTDAAEPVPGSNADIVKRLQTLSDNL